VSGVSNVERQRRADEVVQSALDCGPGERVSLLDALCAGDTSLRAEVESLLSYQERARDFIEVPAYALNAEMFTDEFDFAQVEGRQIGIYRVVREIGRGGMGAVFLAERADGEFKQEVALKVVRRSFADSELKRRFRQERQILASFNHPNIARLLDGGVSDDGEPYLVMEYVEGARIDDYCEGRKLSNDERLRLFLEVCRGVSYAHQHLVVHRDIKPSNILVTADGVPKLLDFGIAKLIYDEQAGEHTRTEMRAYTPNYASPEQMSGGQITTASDVYSLGVLLRDLLYGGRLQPEAEKAPGGWRSEAPGRKTSAANVPTRQDGENRKAQTKLRRFVSGELENIIKMARREDPARRYASAAQLAEDVQRYLDGLPVRAQKDSFTYRAGKFIRRNKVGVAAAVIILLTLAGGIIATVWQARRATREAQIAAQERDRARVEAIKAERINAFLQSIFASADPAWYSSGYGQRGEVKVVDVLEQAGRRIDTDFKDQPEIRAELHHTIGTTYQSLSRFESAKTHFRAAVEAYRGLYGERHPELAEAIYYLAASVQSLGDIPAALALFRQSLEMFRAVDPNNANVPYLLSDFATLLNNTGETVAAEQAAREGLELSRKRYGDEHVLTTTLLTRLGVIYETRGDLRQAETFYQTALAIFNRMPNGRMHSFGVLAYLGRLSMLRGDLKQAEAQVRESHNLSRQVYNETHSQNIAVLFQLAEIHYRQGAYADAEKEATSLLDLLRRVEVRDRTSESAGLSLMSLIHAKTNRPASANAFLKEALALFNSLSDEGKYAYSDLPGEALVVMKHEAEARAFLLKSYEYHARTHGAQNPEAIRTRQWLERLDAATHSP
jgi:eukaryotic-like serine/threonine-protein kinase